MKYEFIPDFHLFEGEGMGDAGATASSSDSKQDVKTIQYGRSKGEGQTSGQVGSDNGAETDDLSARWNAITGKGGEFHDLLGQTVSDAIQKRFKNQADLQAQVDGISENLSPLFQHYGLKSGDFEGLQNAVSNDDAFYKAGAEREGLDIEQYKQKLKLQADSDRLHQLEESYQQEKARQEMYGKWELDAAEIQQSFPAFDLGMEIQTNEKFAQLLDAGIDVKTAFQVAHFDELNQGMQTYQHRTATQQVVNTIQQRAARPMEGALSHAPAIQRKSDPSSLSNEDLDEINRRVANGESISF